MAEIVNSCGLFTFRWKHSS